MIPPTITARRSSRNRRVAALALALAVVAGARADAHRRDEYLQAARLLIDPDRVQIELDLTPGIAIVDRLLADIDPDHNGTIDTGESDAYVQRVLRDITLEMDALPIALTVTSRRFPSVDSMRRGEGAIHIDLAATMAVPGAGPHRVHYRNIHRSDIGAYLANALIPSSDRVNIRSQQRDDAQHDLVIDYALRPAWATRTMWLLGTGALVAIGLLWWRSIHRAYVRDRRSQIRHPAAH